MKKLTFFGLSLLFITLVQTASIGLETGLLSKEDAAQLTDSDLDVLFLLFKTSELEDLLSDAGTIRHVYVLAQEVFVRKFSKRPLEISDARCWCLDQTICINDKEEFSRIIKNFGHFIPKLMLRFTNTVNLTEIAEMNELINSYCGDTLNELEIASSTSYVFDGMSTPFKRLKTLTLDSEFIGFANLSLTFGELFPRLTVLYMNKIHMDCPSVIVDAFPNLKHVSLRCFNLNVPNHLSDEHFQEFLKKNHQIRSLTLNDVNRTLLSIVNQILPNLEGLELVSYYPSDNFDNGEVIVFENVKEFRMGSSSVSAPRNVEFPSLVTFMTDGCGSTFCNRWIELIENAPQLENMSVKPDRIYTGQFERLAAATSNLVQVFVRVAAGNMDQVSAADIVSLVRNNQNLRKMYLTATRKGKLDPIDTAVNLLFNEFEDKFKISSSKIALVVELPQ